MKSTTAALVAGVVGCAFVFHIPVAQAAVFKEKVLYSFCSQQNCADGSIPQAGVINVSGTLYGTTVNGGGSNLPGTVFAVDRRTGAERVVYSFCSQPNCTDGYQPDSGLIDVKGILYGTTTGGGAVTGGCGIGCGAVFAVDPNTGAETVVHSFGNGTDGQIPFAGLTDVKGTLYGTTAYGGSYGYGTVFALNPTTGAETVLHSFGNGTDGSVAYGGVIAMNGKFYGTTYDGGTHGTGIVFSVDRKTGAEKVLYSFSGGTDGGYPYAGVIALNGILYGTTTGGGSGTGCGFVGCGTVFSLDRTTGTETVLHSFSPGTDGAVPFAGPLAVNGTLYGTTTGGGTGNCGGGCGTAFSIDASTGMETVLYSFAGSPDGVSPHATLIAVKGTMYGTAGGGGAHAAGTVYRLKQKR